MIPCKLKNHNFVIYDLAKNRVFLPTYTHSFYIPNHYQTCSIYTSTHSMRSLDKHVLNFFFAQSISSRLPTLQLLYDTYNLILSKLFYIYPYSTRVHIYAVLENSNHVNYRTVLYCSHLFLYFIICANNVKKNGKRNLVFSHKYLMNLNNVL